MDGCHPPSQTLPRADRPRVRDPRTRIADGSTNQDVGRQLALSAKTVANNLSRVFAKLQVTDRAQAIVKAHRAGIGNRPSP